MFGGPLDYPKQIKVERMENRKYDINMPWLTPGVYAHMGRPPNTDHHVRLLHYKQRQKESEAELTVERQELARAEAMLKKYDKHFIMKQTQREIREKIGKGLRDYEADLERRREKLRQLYCREEQEFVYETVDKAQRGKHSKLQEMREKAEALQAAREKERLDVVEKKRIQQYTNRCLEYRPMLRQKIALDTQKAHLQQMEEKKSRVEAEKELDLLWCKLADKEQEAKKERQEQDKMHLLMTQKALSNTWEQQIVGKKKLEQEIRQNSLEDLEELKNMCQQMETDEKESEKEKIFKRTQRAKELLEQIQEQEKFHTQRENEEKALEQAFAKLAQMELELEQKKAASTTLEKRKEMAIYRNYLKELEESKRAEERKLDELLEEKRVEIQKKQEAVRCKIIKAKRDLLKNVLNERRQQLEWKKQNAEEQLKLKKAENEYMRLQCETNQQLQEEGNRKRAKAAAEYRQDLTKQIDYRNCLLKKEREELERQLELGMEEERKFRQMVEDLLAETVKDQKPVHPFRRVLEQNCQCREDEV